MTHINIEVPPSIAEVVAAYQGQAPGELVAALIVREEQVAETFRLAGMQFGLYPQIINEVFAGVGFGAARSEAERDYIRAQFVELMNALAEEHRQHGGE